MTQGKPSGVAAAQAVATDIGRLAELESRPAAWATFYPNGSTASVYTGRQPPNAEPLYRSRALTDEEREAVRFALKSLDWPLDGPQLAVVARTVGASCEVPEHRMKATLRGLLERMA